MITPRSAHLDIPRSDGRIDFHIDRHIFIEAVQAQHPCAGIDEILAALFAHFRKALAVELPIREDDSRIARERDEAVVAVTFRQWEAYIDNSAGNRLRTGMSNALGFFGEFRRSE